MHILNFGSLVDILLYTPWYMSIFRYISRIKDLLWCLYEENIFDFYLAFTLIPPTKLSVSYLI